jgi:uncharacterized membrane protein
MEDIIEAQLLERYGVDDDGLNAFMGSLENKEIIKKYEEINRDTVDTLFAFTDFEKFKKQMIDAKKLGEQK